MTAPVDASHLRISAHATRRYLQRISGLMPTRVALWGARRLIREGLLEAVLCADGKHPGQCTYRLSDCVVITKHDVVVTVVTVEQWGWLRNKEKDA